MVAAFVREKDGVGDRASHFVFLVNSDAIGFLLGEERASQRTRRAQRVNELLRIAADRFFLSHCFQKPLL